MAAFTMAMLVSSDLARSRDFYRDVLGLTVGTDAPPHWVDFKLEGGAVLGIHPAGERTPLQPQGSLSLGFAVDDVDAFVREAEAKGVTVLAPPRDENFGRLALIADPDGYMLQLVTYKR